MYFLPSLFCNTQSLIPTAQRILHFGHYHMLWEFRCRQESEALFLGEAAETFAETRTTRYFDIFDRRSWDVRGRPENFKFIKWCDILITIVTNLSPIWKIVSQLCLGLPQLSIPFQQGGIVQGYGKFTFLRLCCGIANTMHPQAREFVSQDIISQVGRGYLSLLLSRTIYITGGGTCLTSRVSRVNLVLSIHMVVRSCVPVLGKQK